jgi:hypothetical protein
LKFCSSPGARAIEDVNEKRIARFAEVRQRAEGQDGLIRSKILALPLLKLQGFYFIFDEESYIILKNFFK